MGRHHVTIVVNEETLVHQHYQHRRQVLWIIEIFMKKYDFDKLKIEIEEYIMKDDAQYYYKDITKEVITELVISKF